MQLGHSGHLETVKSSERRFQNLNLSEGRNTTLLFVFVHSYEFKVKPKNELGEGPPSEPVTFNTESGTVDFFPPLVLLWLSVGEINFLFFPD